MRKTADTMIIQTRALPIVPKSHFLVQKNQEHEYRTRFHIADQVVPTDRSSLMSRTIGGTENLDERRRHRPRKTTSALKDGLMCCAVAHAEDGWFCIW